MANGPTRGSKNDPKSAFVFFLLVALIAYPIRAYAYIDPGAGSLAYQSILGMFLGAAVFFRQIRTHIQRWRGPTDPSSPPAATKAGRSAD